MTGWLSEGREHGDRAGHRRSAKCEPGAGDLGLRDQLLGVEPDRAAVDDLHQGDVADQHPDRAAGGDPDPGRLGRPDPGRRADRPLRRADRCSPSSRWSTIVPVLLVAFAGSHRFLSCCCWFSGSSSVSRGTTFAIGIPFAKAWYEPARRGFATGVFGAGMGGTALSAFFTPRFVIWFGYVPAHVIIAVALALTALLVWIADEGFARAGTRTPTRCCRN